MSRTKRLGQTSHVNIQHSPDPFNTRQLIITKTDPSSQQYNAGPPLSLVENMQLQPRLNIPVPAPQEIICCCGGGGRRASSAVDVDVAVYFNTGEQSAESIHWELQANCG